MSAQASRPAIPEADPLLPLWRGAQAFRLASLVYAIAVQATSASEYARPTLSWALIAVQVLWTGIAVTALTFDLHRRLVVGIELVLVLALAFSSWVVAPRGFWVTHESLPTTLWCANVVVSVALLYGPLLGTGLGLVIGLAVNAVSSQLSDPPWRDASVPVLMSIGFGMGILARTAVRSNDQLRAAVELRAATEERERLARQVHDGALQVLALVARRGGVVDAELAEMADTQQQALRGYLSQLPAPRRAALGPAAAIDTEDLAARLTELEGPTTRVSVPPGPVPLPVPRAAELVAAVQAALHNVAAHAGPEVTAYVLVEDLGDEVLVSVRDDGRGIPVGRLDAAAAAGRLGVSHSIRGRIEALGGQAELFTGPGEGTEWELHVPRLRIGQDKEKP